MAFEQISERGDADLWTLPLNGPRQAPLMASVFNDAACGSHLTASS